MEVLYGIALLGIGFAAVMAVNWEFKRRFKKWMDKGD